MEELAQDGNKDSQSAVKTLHALMQKHLPVEGQEHPGMFYYVLSERHEFRQLEEQDFDHLEKAGLIEHPTPYKTAYYTSPNKLEVHLTEKGTVEVGRLVSTTTTVTETKRTVTEQVLEPPEEPAWKQNKKYKQFARTERGSAIVSSCPEALISDIQGNIAVMRSGTIKEPEWKGRQFWLKYCLLYRFDEIPEPLRHEAQDWRDLPYPKRRKK